jgi:hypothetical protein
MILPSSGNGAIPHAMLNMNYGLTTHPSISDRTKPGQSGLSPITGVSTLGKEVRMSRRHASKSVMRPAPVGDPPPRLTASAGPSGVAVRP